MPRKGRRVPELNEDAVRELGLDSYRILYEIKSDDLIEVLAVIHKRQHLEAEEIPRDQRQSSKNLHSSRTVLDRDLPNIRPTPQWRKIHFPNIQLVQFALLIKIKYCRHQDSVFIQKLHFRNRIA